MYIIATKEDDINLILFVLRPINSEHIKNRLLNSIYYIDAFNYLPLMNVYTISSHLYT